MRHLALATAIAALTYASEAAAVTQIKLAANDATANDDFGASVALSGTTAIVGAAGDDDAGGSSGSAYLFDIETGTQIAKLTAGDAAVGDFFGASAAISDTTAIVGATGDDDAGLRSGSAYLFDIETGTQIAKLTAGDAARDDDFGTSVAVSGTTAIVGAAGDDDAGLSSGSAYLFDTETGTQIAKLTAEDAAAGDVFGASVAISDTTAIVGAFGDDDAGSNSGSAYLIDIETGTQIAKLTARDAGVGDLFGRSVAISDTTAIVGAPFDDDGGSGSGSAYLFDIETGTQIAKLTAGDAAVGDLFGLSVAVSGTTAIVGASGNDDAVGDAGAAYLFDIETGTQIAKLTAEDAAAADFFGFSVAISDTTAIVGAFGNDDAGGGSGSAYAFDASSVIPPATIPLPGGLVLLSSAIALLALRRRARG